MICVNNDFVFQRINFQPLPSSILVQSLDSYLPSARSEYLTYEHLNIWDKQPGNFQES